MWVLALYDLPTDTKVDRANYRQFRDKILKAGFVMLQYSVYARACATHEEAEKNAKRVEHCLPPEGEVRVITLTSQQFARMKVFFGAKTLNPEKEPDQLSFF